MLKSLLKAGMIAAVAFALPGALFAAKDEPQAPAIWLMQDDDSTIYLFGTFHILPVEIEWETQAYLDAMKDAEITVVEADISSLDAKAALAKTVQEKGLNPAGVTLSSVLGEERAARFGKFANDLGAPMQLFEPLRPWFATLSLNLLAMQKAGFDPNSGVETVLLAQAEEEGDSIEFLETGVEQISTLANLGDNQSLENFDASLDQMEEFSTIMTASLEAWRTGNSEDLEQLINAQLRDMSPDVFQKLLLDRNANWVVQIKKMMSGEGDYFIAVGAGHLVGEGSVISLLEEEGFDLKRLQ